MFILISGLFSLFIINKN